MKIKRSIFTWFSLLALLCAVGICVYIAGRNRANKRRSQLLATQPNFAEHVAPIIFDNCSSCHRPGASAPFNMLGYEDVRQRAEQVLDVIETRFMPPWSPSIGFAQYHDEPTLKDTDVDVIRRWVDTGSHLGDASKLPALPPWSEEWELGPPDLIVSMPKSYTLQADGADVYRNFVIPLPVTEARYVTGFEFKPTNPKVVHHVAIKVDDSGELDQVEQSDGTAGFDNTMTLPKTARSPAASFLSWQPGRKAARTPADMAWSIQPGSSLILQTHLRPSGKQELVNAKIGLYFSETPPTRFAKMLCLFSTDIDIPAGTEDYSIENAYELPVDVEVVGVLPHAHYLAKQMQGIAELPDGSTKWLLHIEDWDFNWQRDYRFVSPIQLPKGTTIRQRFTYDNSKNNITNPNSPPQNIRYGPQTTDEMGELWLQLVPKVPAELDTLTKHMQAWETQNVMSQLKRKIELSPNDPDAHVKYGELLYVLQRKPEALKSFQRALAISPDSVQANYQIANLHLDRGDIQNALVYFQRTVSIAPEHIEALCNLGVVYTKIGNLAAAEQQYERALKVAPSRAATHLLVGKLAIRKGAWQQAESAIQRAIQLNPRSSDSHNSLGTVYANQQQFEKAATQYRRAIELDPENSHAKSNLERVEARR